MDQAKDSLLRRQTSSHLCLEYSDSPSRPIPPRKQHACR